MDTVPIKKIVVEIIPHDTQRYNTIGDYFIDGDGTLQVRISQVGGMDYEMPIIIHELVEWFLCQQRGVRMEDIDAFDHLFELERSLGRHQDEEPGDDPNAPYREEHRFAENIERQVVYEAGLHWNDYEEKVSEPWITQAVKEKRL